MEVYIKELPNSCDECPCCNSDVDYGACCNLGAFNHYEYYQTIYKHPKCPLKSTSQLLAEERKKVIEKIKKQSVKHPTITIYAQGKEFGSEYSIDETILDQIERGEL